MSEQQMNLIDPLNIGVDLNDVNTLRPVIRESQYLMRIKEATVKPKKDDNTKNNMIVVLELLEPADQLEGTEQVQPGFTLSKYLPLQQSDHEKAPDFKIDLVRLMDAALKTQKGTRPQLANWQALCPMITGAEVIGIVKVETNKQTDEKTNSVARLLPAN